MNWTLHTGDCRIVLGELAENSVDACVTDSPYELAFMGKRWDRTGVSFQPETWAAVLRVLKPGAHLLASGGTRTYHRLASAIEDAGFEIRDQIDWLYGTGFPKSLNLMNDDAWEPRAQSIDRGMAAGRWPANVILGHSPDCVLVGERDVDANGSIGKDTAAAAAAAAAAKTARTTFHDDKRPRGEWNAYGNGDGTETVGAWRCAIDCPVAELDAQAGTRRSAGTPSTSIKRTGVTSLAPTQGQIYDDTGAASRFFYVVKPSRRERDAGLDHLPSKTAAETVERKEGSAGLGSPRAGAGRTSGARNHHPTVKPVELMRYLCRLITPMGGLVLDPFAGSGTTGIAALQEGLRFVGIDLDPEYARIAIARIEEDAPLFNRGRSK